MLQWQETPRTCVRMLKDVLAQTWSSVTEVVATDQWASNVTLHMYDVCRNIQRKHTSYHSSRNVQHLFRQITLFPGDMFALCRIMVHTGGRRVEPTACKWVSQRWFVMLQLGSDLLSHLTFQAFCWHSSPKMTPQQGNGKMIKTHVMFYSEWLRSLSWIYLTVSRVDSVSALGHWGEKRLIKAVPQSSGIHVFKSKWVWLQPASILVRECLGLK